MKRPLIIATKNKNKKRELKRLLKGFKARVLSLSDLDVQIPRVVENGRTFEQNAVKKALKFSRYIKGLVLAEDSGLIVRALGGKPGVRSSRFTRAKARDRENNAKLLKLMKNVPAAKRRAVFISVAAIAESGNLIGVSEGQCRGRIGFEAKGKSGFGYDPLFTPEGYSRTFAEFKTSFKNKISHRAKALRGAKAVIRKYL